MLVGDKVSHSAVTEAYCLISSYIREEGKLGTNYDKEHLLEFVKFVAEILKHPENFNDVDKTPKERNLDGSLKHPVLSEEDIQGLA
jgi:hypothetical protein